MRITVFPRWQTALLALGLWAEGLYLPVSGAAVRGLLWGALPVLAAAWLFPRLLRARGARDWDALCRTFPAPAETLLRLAAAFAALCAIGHALLRLSAFLQATAFPNAPRWLTALAFAALFLPAARRGAAAAAMWAYPIAWLTGIVVLLSLLITLPDCEWTHAAAVWRGAFPDTAAFCAPLRALPLLLLCANDPDLRAGGAVRGVLLGGGGLALLCLRALLVLGAGAADVPYPAFAAAGVFSVGDFLQRGEILLACVLAVCEGVRCAALGTLVASPRKPRGKQKHVSAPQKSA